MKSLILALVCLAIALPLHAEGENVHAEGENAERIPITRELKDIEVTHQGAKVKLERRPHRHAANCPPACILPMHSFGDAAVRTVGELEVIDYLQRRERGEPILLVDTRSAKRVAKGVIPGAINIPHKKLKDSDPMDVADILEQQFGAVQLDGLWDFRDARTLVLYCDGPICARSSKAIRVLLKYGYPPHKLKYYRGGFRTWEALGLTTVKP